MLDWRTEDFIFLLKSLMYIGSHHNNSTSGYMKKQRKNCIKIKTNTSLHDL